MSFDYSTAGLPANAKWELAAANCHAWLTQNMSMFGPARITSFMHNQPLAAAGRLLDTCDDVSEESITVLLLGPCKGMMLESAVAENMARNAFGDRAVDLILTLHDSKNAVDAAMLRDAGRVFLAEGVSTMSDQMIGRARIDAHHQTRWNILNSLGQTFAALKGQDPKLDAVFEDAFAQSKQALDALDAAAAAKPQNPRPPRG